MFSPTRFHMLLNTAVLPVKWMPASSGESMSMLEISLRVARQEVDDARRQAGGFEHLERVVAAQHRGRRRLPDDGVAHQRRRGGQVAADRREVERRDGVDEPFEVAVLHLVPHAGAAHRLLVVELLREPGVEPPEVDHLGGGVDLGLERRLRLAEHRRRVDRRAPCRRQQLGGAENDGRAVFPRPARPLAARLGCRGDRLLHVLWPGLVVLRQHVLVVVRHDRLLDLAGANFLAADDERNVDLLGRHRFQARFELGPLRRARRVGAIRVVRRRRHASDAGERGVRTGSQGCPDQSAGPRSVSRLVQWRQGLSSSGLEG